MIIARFTQNTFHITGHAEYAEHGRDIVCAGVSVLAQACVTVLEELTDVEKKVKPGDMYVSYVLWDDIFDTDVKAVIRTLRVGIEEIAKQYPDYVKVELE